MKQLSELYDFAAEQNIAVDSFQLKKREALAFMDLDGSCFIAIDPTKIESEMDERMKLGHELGHCITGSFYNEYSAYDCRQRHENRADKWEIQQMIPAEALDEAIADGYTELWSLAEYFEVPVDFMKKAVCLHTYGNLAVDCYF